MSVYSTKNRDHDYALIKSRMMEILSRKPQEIEDLFMKEPGNNIAYMENHGSEYLSYGSGSSLSLLQKAETIAERAYEDAEGTLRRDVNSIYFSSLSKRKMEFLQQIVEEREDDRSADLYDRIVAPFDASDCIERTNTGKSLGPDGILSYENYIEKAFHLKKDLWENEIAQRAVSKTYRKLSTHICGGLKGNGGKATVDEVIASSITGFNRFVHNQTTWNTRMFEVYTHSDDRNINDGQFLPFLLFCGISKWRIAFDNGREEFQNVCRITEIAVQMVIRAYLIGFWVNWLNEKYKDPFSDAESDPEEIMDNGHILSEEDMRFVYREINNIDYNEMMMACYFASAVEINRDQQIERDIENLKLSSKSQTSLSRELFDAKKEIKRLEENNERLEEQIEKEKELCAKAKKEEWDRRYAENTIEKLRTECCESERKHKKEVKELNAEIESLRAQLSQLEQVIEDSADSGNKVLEEECENHVDHEKRYYFVCDHAVTCKRLMDEFPNSKCSMDFEYTGGECGRFDAAVFIIPQVKHMNYYRYKNICKDNGIPVVHSNTTGIRTIKILLVQQGFGS